MNYAPPEPDDIVFDLGTFMADIDALRVRRGLEWKDVAEESNVTASSICRLRKRENGFITANITALARLSDWAGLTLDPYVGTEKARRDAETFRANQPLPPTRPPISDCP